MKCSFPKIYFQTDTDEQNVYWYSDWIIVSYYTHVPTAENLGNLQYNTTWKCNWYQDKTFTEQAKEVIYISVSHKIILAWCTFKFPKFDVSFSLSFKIMVAFFLNISRKYSKF